MTRWPLLLVVLVAGCGGRTVDPQQEATARAAFVAALHARWAVARDACADWTLVSVYLRHGHPALAADRLADVGRLQQEWEALRTPGTLAGAIAGVC